MKSRYTPANGTAASAGNSSMNSSASLPNGILANGDILLQHDNAATKASSMSVSALNGSLANKNEYNQQQHSLKSKILNSLKQTKRALKLSKSCRHSKPTNCI